jgi:large subunit ribosomal protein L24
MKTAFSTKWKTSTQPRKQRKYRFNAPLHARGTFLHAHLSKELRAKHSTRALRVRTGDEVQAMRGQYAGRSGKVERVDTYRSRVFVTGLDQARRDGSRRLYPLQPSNLMITKLVDEKRRLPGSTAPAKKTAAPAKPVKAKTEAKAPAANATKSSKPASAPAAKAKVSA